MGGVGQGLYEEVWGWLLIELAKAGTNEGDDREGH